MQNEPKLNTPSLPALAVAEAHARNCWAALERHAITGPTSCGCYKHASGWTIVTEDTCIVGAACAEEYACASRRVREIQAQLTYAELEPGDYESSAVPL